MAALLLQLTLCPVIAGDTGPSSPAAPATKSSGSAPVAGDKGAELAALEKKLLGAWQGGPCEGNYTFNSDGTYEVDSFTPGGNTLTGIWFIRWDGLPPTLVVTCKTSDFKNHDPTRDEYAYLGKPRELKLIQLTNDSFVYRYSDYPEDMHNKHRSRK